MTTLARPSIPRSDPAWAELMAGPRGQRASARRRGSPRSPTRTASTCRRNVLVDDDGRPRAGLAYAELDDFLGHRLISVPFCDYLDPVVDDRRRQWHAAGRPARSTRDLPFQLTVLDADAAAPRPALRAGRRDGLARHRPRRATRRRSSPRSTGAPARTCAPRERNDVTVRFGSDLEDVHALPRAAPPHAQAQALAARAAGLVLREHLEAVRADRQHRRRVRRARRRRDRRRRSISCGATSGTTSSARRSSSARRCGPTSCWRGRACASPVDRGCRTTTGASATSTSPASSRTSASSTTEERTRLRAALHARGLHEPASPTRAGPVLGELTDAAHPRRRARRRHATRRRDPLPLLHLTPRWPASTRNAAALIVVGVAAVLVIARGRGRRVDRSRKHRHVAAARRRLLRDVGAGRGAAVRRRVRRARAPLAVGAAARQRRRRTTRSRSSRSRSRDDSSYDADVAGEVQDRASPATSPAPPTRSSSGRRASGASPTTWCARRPSTRATGT